jgi:quinol monooxygenase YgiN
MIGIEAKMVVREDKREEFLQEAKALIEGTRNEEGYISYTLFESTENKNEFLMLEEWKDEEAVASHNGAPHFVAFVGKAKELLAGPLQAKKFEKNT